MSIACRSMPRVRQRPENIQTQQERLHVLRPQAKKHFVDQRIMAVRNADGTKADFGVLCKAASQQGKSVHAASSQ